MSPLETKIRALVAALDTSALEALANRGLLRRAQKDLERGVSVQIEQEDAGAISFKVDQFKVSLPEAGPARAKCSCPAAGVCQHILTVVLFLQNESRGSAESTADSGKQATVEQELLSITREQLESWAGKASFRAALRLASQHSAEIKSERGVVIRFPAINTDCHYAPGSGLDGLIVSGNAKDERSIAAAAVIVFQKLKGVQWDIPQSTSGPLEESEGAPRSRNEVLDACQQLLAEMMDGGLARVSLATQQRLATLAVSAIGVNLPRLSLVLRGLSDECALVISRDARSDLGRLLNRMAHAHALCAAIQLGGSNPRPDLVGWHRTRYDEIGHLDLLGAAAWPWRTASGYAGLTLLFWDTAGKSWNSWSESRPAHQQTDFQPVARYTQPGPWEGAESPRQLARSCVRLMNARRNPVHRLSGSSKSRVLVTGRADLETNGVPVIEDWTALLKSLDAQTSIGLKETNPLDSIFALRPSEWGQRGYNPVNQLFSWLLLDSQKRPLFMELGFDTLSEPAIKYLESAPADSVEGSVIIGRAQRTPRGLALVPYAIHQPNGTVTQLWLDTAESVQSSPPKSVDLEDVEEPENENEEENGLVTSLSPISPTMTRLLDEVEEALLAVAETGVAGLNPLRIERLRQLEPSAGRLGLQHLAAAMANVVNDRQPSTVLRCFYLSQLHRFTTPLAA